MPDRCDGGGLAFAATRGPAGADRRVAATDGRQLAATVFLPPRARRLVIVAAATGVRRRYYAAFALWLAARGAVVVTFDYRGIGDSASGALSRDAARMRDWGEHDLAGVFHWARTEWPDLAPALVAHSVGGQVAGLVPGIEACDVLVFVGSTHGWVRHWPWWMQPYLQALWRLLLPAAIRVKGYFPSAWFGLGEPLPPGVARDWAAWCLDRNYLFGPAFGLDTSRYGRISARLVAWSFSDDFIAPRRAVDALVARYPAAAVERRHIVSRREIGRRVGHFGFFRDANQERLWRQTALDLGV